MEGTDEEQLRRSAQSDDVASLYDAYVRTTSPPRHLRVYKDATMAFLAKPLMHHHTAYCGKYALGHCRFGFPLMCAKRARRKTNREMWNSRSKNKF